MSSDRVVSSTNKLLYSVPASPPPPPTSPPPFERSTRKHGEELLASPPPSPRHKSELTEDVGMKKDKYVKQITKPNTQNGKNKRKKKKNSTQKKAQKRPEQKRPEQKKAISKVKRAVKVGSQKIKTEVKEEVIEPLKKLWERNMDGIQKHIDNFGSLPVIGGDFDHLARWLNYEMINYHEEYDEALDERRDAWNIIIEKNKELFISFEDSWEDLFQELTGFITKEDRFPSSHMGKFRKLARWANRQKKDFMKGAGDMKLGNPRRLMWETLSIKYPQLVEGNIEKWYDTFDVLNEYITTERKFPSRKGYYRSLALWKDFQDRSYRLKVKAMDENDPRRDLWGRFLEDSKRVIDNPDESFPEYYIPSYESTLRVDKLSCIVPPEPVGVESPGSTDENTEDENDKRYAKILDDASKYFEQRGITNNKI